MCTRTHMYSHTCTVHTRTHTLVHTYTDPEKQRSEWHRRVRHRAVGQKFCLSLFSRTGDRFFWTISLLLRLPFPPCLSLLGSCGLCFPLSDEGTPAAGYTEQLRQLRGSSLKAMARWWSSEAVNTNEGTFTPKESQALLLRRPLAKYKKSFFFLF